MDKTDIRRATIFIMAVFALQPMAFGAWLAMIPHVKETLQLSKSDLALALLGMPLALIPTLQLASRIVAKIGPRKTFAILLPVQTLAAVTPFLATGLGSLFAALAVLGAVVAFLEVGINTYAGRLEKAAGVNIMARCHGFWALGVGIGSFAATQLFGFGALQAAFVTSAVSAALGVWVGLSLPKLAGEKEASGAPPRKLRDMPKPLFIISAFVLVITMAEGAMSDWAAVYLAERRGGVAEDAGIAVTLFATFLALGRFMGDALKSHLGARGAARLTVGIALLGLMCLTVFEPVYFTFAGFALMGLGVCLAFPLGVSQAAALDDRYESQNIATMAMIAMSGFLVGPPVIGFIAEAISLRVGLMMLFPGLLLALFLSAAFPTRQRSTESEHFGPDSG